MGMNDDGEFRYLSTREAADYLGIKPQTLRVWRMKGSGPPYRRLLGGRRGWAIYKSNEIEAWCEARKFTCTKQEEAPGQRQGGTA